MTPAGGGAMPTYAPPPPPKSEKPEDLGFTKQPMVQWFSPWELIRAGIKALISSLFGAYADRREIEAALALADDLETSQRTPTPAKGGPDAEPEGSRSAGA